MNQKYKPVIKDLDIAIMRVKMQPDGIPPATLILDPFRIKPSIMSLAVNKFIKSQSN
jgi:hypothetical protein